MTKVGPLEIATAAGSKLVVECPICKSTDKWHRVAEPQDEKIGYFKPSLIAVAKNGNMMGLPIAVFACANCGFIMNQMIATGAGNDVSE
jgi:hypothetical protein